MVTSASFIQKLFSRSDHKDHGGYMLKELVGTYLDRLPNEKFMLRSMLMAKYGRLADTVLRTDLRGRFHAVSFRPDSEKFQLGALVWVVRYDIIRKRYIPVSMLVLIKKLNPDLSDLDALRSAFSHFTGTRRLLTNGRSSYTNELITYKLYVTDEEWTNVHLPTECFTQVELERMFHS